MTEINWKTLLILACLKIPQVGPFNVKKILASINDIKSVIDNFNVLRQMPIRPIQHALKKGTLTAEIWSKYVELSFEELAIAQLNQIELINIDDRRYPQNLKSLRNCPVIIYAKGNLDLLNNRKMVAIVGTRTPSTTGLEIERELTEWFVEKDYVIVSGLAQGCDTCAHQVAVEKSGKTIAILAAGLDQPIYPKQNTELAQQILFNDGLLISTYPLGTKLFPKFLAARDEWQSGISKGIVVIETGLTGGTNLTIKSALSQQRQVAICDQIPADGNRKYLEMNSELIQGVSSPASLEDFTERMDML